MSEEKKQVPLRLSKSLYDALAAWAADEFRSVNGQIEYLLAESVRRHAGGKTDSAEKTPTPSKKKDP